MCRPIPSGPRCASRRKSPAPAAARRSASQSSRRTNHRGTETQRKHREKRENKKMVSNRVERPMTGRFSFSHFSVFSLCLCASVVSPLSAQTSFPMVTHAHPVAVQRGKTADVAVEGQMNFAGAYKALFEGNGLSADVTPTTGTTVRSVKMKVAVGAEAAPGVREVRVATALGLSSIGQLVIVDEPVVVEATSVN